MGEYKINPWGYKLRGGSGILGDTARLPYGTKSAETIIKFPDGNALFLLTKNVKIIVVACNSASSYAVPYLQDKLDIPVIGVIESGAEAARPFLSSSIIHNSSLNTIRFPTPCYSHRREPGKGAFSVDYLKGSGSLWVWVFLQEIRFIGFDIFKCRGFSIGPGNGHINRFFFSYTHVLGFGVHR